MQEKKPAKVGDSEAAAYQAYILPSDMCTVAINMTLENAPPRKAVRAYDQVPHLLRRRAAHRDVRSMCGG